LGAKRFIAFLQQLPMNVRTILAAAILCTCASTTTAHHSRYTADLTGHAESPPNSSTATGRVVVTIDFDLLTMQIAADFSGLEGTVTEAHIHAATTEIFAGTAIAATPLPTLEAFPTGITTGTYFKFFENLLDPAVYNPAFISASGTMASDAMNALFHALDDGKAYFDIHSSTYPDGEIRAFLVHVPGDYNDNGIVDAADYVLWRNTEGNIGEGLAADSNNDNKIDDDDYLAWRENFGSNRHDQHEHTHEHGAGSSSSVPEPSTVLLGLLASLGFLKARQR
jgi:hypothetical protein